MLRLRPGGKRDIASILRESYSCINPHGSEFKTSPKNLKEYPTWYLRGMLSEYPQTRKRWAGDRSQKMMNWAAWELARSTLDESVKNSVGLMLFADKVANLEEDSIRTLIPHYDLKYVSSFPIAALYFCHPQSVLSGLFLAGLVIRDGRLIARDVSSEPHWKCINESWAEDWSREIPQMPHAKVFEQYDSIRRNQLMWLPLRSAKLVELKSIREAVTYRTERMGGWSAESTLEEVKRSMPEHVDFQASILDSLCKLVEEGAWNRSYDPHARTKRFETRFAEYRNLVEFCC